MAVTGEQIRYVDARLSHEACSLPQTRVATVSANDGTKRIIIETYDDQNPEKHPKSSMIKQRADWKQQTERLGLAMFEHKVKPIDLHKKIHMQGSTMHINTSRYILRHWRLSRAIGRPEAMDSRCLQIQNVAAGSAMLMPSLRCVADRISRLACDD